MFSLLIYSNNKTDAPKYNFIIYNYILINAIPDNSKKRFEFQLILNKKKIHQKKKIK